MRELTAHPVAQRVLFALFLVALMLGVWLVLAPFLVPIAWAGILAYSSWPLYSRLLRSLGGRANIAALLMTLGIAAVAVIPMLWLLVVLKVELSAAAGMISGKLLNGEFLLPRFVTDMPLIGTDVAAWFAQATADPASFKTEIHSLFSYANQMAVSVIGGIGRNLAKMGFALLTLFFAYRGGAGFMEQFACVLESLLGNRVRGYLEAVGGATRGVLYGIVLTALAQGATAGLGYWAAGLQAPVMLAAITVLFAMIPFGTPLVWGSLGLWLLFTGETGAGAGLLLWGALAVSWVDNIVRPLVLAQSIKIPFILAFFGVLGGLAAFGLVGLFLGPVILAVAYAVWREWLEERSAPSAGNAV